MLCRAAGEGDADDASGALVDPVARESREVLRGDLERRHLVFHGDAPGHLGEFAGRQGDGELGSPVGWLRVHGADGARIGR